MDTMAHLGVMPLHEFNICGNTTLVHLRNLSKNVWIHTVILALNVMYHISLGWLEMIIKGYRDIIHKVSLPLSFWMHRSLLK